MIFELEWDSDKAAANLEKHSVAFEDAATIFDDPLMITVGDLDHSLDEDRYVSIGTTTQGRLLVVVYTERVRTIRIISARGPTAKERRDYEDDDT